MRLEKLQPVTASGSRFASILGVQGREGGPVASMVTLNFAVSTAFVLVQTSAFGLFIETFSSHALPYAYFSVALLSSLVAFTYLRISQRLEFRAGLYVNLAFLAAVSLVFWLGLRSSSARWFIFLLPFWFQTLVNLANIVVWHMAGHIFNVRQARRLFGLVVAGNWVANIVGGMLVASFLSLVRPADLYLLATVALAVSALVLRAALSHLTESAAPHAEPVNQVREHSGPALALKHPYSRLIFAYTLLWWIGFFIIENIFFHEVEQKFASSGALAAFLGRQLAVMGVIALITTSLLTSRLVRRYGVRFGLLAMPVVVSATVLALALGGSFGWRGPFLFWTATIARTLNVALGFSISQAMGSLLFQPLLGKVRAAAQTISEGIMQPLAIGVAGVILLLFNTVLDFDAVGLSYIFLGIAIPWFWSMFELARRYPLVMSEALKRRALGESTSILFDQSAVAQLRRALEQPRPGLALYALHQLQEIAPQAWPEIFSDELPRLMTHPASEVRLEALKSALALRLPAFLPVLREGIQSERNPQVRSMSLRVLAEMGDLPSMQEVLKALRSPLLAERQGAIIGLMLGGSADDVSAAISGLDQLVNSTSADERLMACAILGEAPWPGAVDRLSSLFQDTVIAVRHAAVQAAGKHADARLTRALLEACDTPATARVAEQALVARGEAGLEDIGRALASCTTGSRFSPPRAMSIVRVLGRLPHSRSRELLLPLMAAADPQLRLQALQSLSRLRYRDTSAGAIFGHIRSEVDCAAWLTAAVDGLQRSGIASAHVLLRHALEADFRQARSRILLLLSFFSDPGAVLRARSAFLRESASHSDMALETIDALLPSSARKWILPLFESSAPGERIAHWRAAGVETPALSPKRFIAALLSANGPIQTSSWACMCAIHAAVQDKVASCFPFLERLASGPPSGPSQMARWALATFAASGSLSGDSSMLSLVEKVLILKSAPLFAETPDNVLAEVASLVEELSFEADQTVFNKGEPGDSLYIVVSGFVRVWDGERLLNELGEGEVFGELALLDPEPRLATIKAVEPTHLLRLNAPHFHEVLESQPEVSAAVIRVITRYLKSQLQYAREASAKLRALEALAPASQLQGV